jgi:hypothetical protein
VVLLDKSTGEEDIMPRSKRKVGERKMAAPRVIVPVPSKEDVWRDSIWGSREAFVKARMEKEGYSAEAAERFANAWEDSLLELKTDPPERLRLA